VYDSACALPAGVNMSVFWFHLLSHNLSQFNMHDENSTCLVSNQMYIWLLWDKNGCDKKKCLRLLLQASMGAAVQ